MDGRNAGRGFCHHAGGNLGPRQIVIPYQPRAAFRSFHDRAQRWAALVCHRRAGKTVAAVNDIIRAAVTCKSRNPLFGYVAPYRSQAKSIAWGFVKHYAQPITADVNESELIVRLKYNGAEIRLFGADNPDSIRGLGFDGVLCDEYGDFKPSVFPTVIRPALSDKQGWATFMGTPKGKNQFWETFDMAQTDPINWFCMSLKASESGILAQGELQDARRTMSEDQYLQEYECSFDAAILGAFYGTEMRLLEEHGHITAVPYDPSLQCYTAWDIGHTDDTSIWWFQMARGEIRIIDFYTISGSGVEDVGKIVRDRGYHYEKHFLPHDAKAKTFAANGKSTIEQLVPLLGFETLSIVPNLSKQDGIQAVRMTLPNCWFDAKKCKAGIEALKQYEREYDEDTKAFRAAPKHNWASNPADAFRYLALSWREETPIRKINPDRPLIAGPGNQATLEDMYAARRPNRRQRI